MEFNRFILATDTTRVREDRQLGKFKRSDPQRLRSRVKSALPGGECRNQQKAESGRSLSRGAPLRDTVIALLIAGRNL